MKFHWLLVLAAAHRRLRGEPVTSSAAMSPAPGATGQTIDGSATAPNNGMPIGFCSQGACKMSADPAHCCCWSTFSQEHHIAYPNPELQERERKCTNPPDGYTLLKQPGYLGSDGFFESLQLHGLPNNPDRALCCAVSNTDVVTIASRETMEENIKEEALPPPPTAWPGPPVNTTPPEPPPPPPPPPNYERIPSANLTIPASNDTFTPTNFSVDNVWMPPPWYNASAPVEPMNITPGPGPLCTQMPAFCVDTCLEFYYCARFPDNYCKTAPPTCSGCMKYAHCPVGSPYGVVHHDWEWEQKVAAAAAAAASTSPAPPVEASYPEEPAPTEAPPPVPEEMNYPAEPGSEPLIAASPAAEAEAMPDLPPASPALANSSLLYGGQPDLAEFSRREHKSNTFDFRDLPRLQAEAAANPKR